MVGLLTPCRSLAYNPTSRRRHHDRTKLFLLRLWRRVSTRCQRRRVWASRAPTRPSRGRQASGFPAPPSTHSHPGRPAGCPGEKNQRYRASGLNLVIAAIRLWQDGQRAPGAKFSQRRPARTPRSARLESHRVDWGLQLARQQKGRQRRI